MIQLNKHVKTESVALQSDNYCFLWCQFSSIIHVTLHTAGHAASQITQKEIIASVS